MMLFSYYSLIIFVCHRKWIHTLSWWLIDRYQGVTINMFWAPRKKIRSRFCSGQDNTVWRCGHTPKNSCRSEGLERSERGGRSLVYKADDTGLSAMPTTLEVKKLQLWNRRCVSPPYALYLLFSIEAGFNTISLKRAHIWADFVVTTLPYLLVTSGNIGYFRLIQPLYLGDSDTQGCNHLTSHDDTQVTAPDIRRFEVGGNQSSPNGVSIF